MRMADTYTFMNMTHLHVKLLYMIHNVVVEFKTCDFRTLSGAFIIRIYAAVTYTIEIGWI